MHASFTYDGQRARGDYGVRRSDVLGQSHPGLDDPLVLHNALSAAVDDGQVSHLPSLSLSPNYIITENQLTKYKLHKVVLSPMTKTTMLQKVKREHKFNSM